MLQSVGIVSIISERMPHSPASPLKRNLSIKVEYLLCENNRQTSEMPTDIVPTAAELFTKYSKKACDAEIKSGFLVLLDAGCPRQDVRVVVYRTSLEHFAVIYPRKRLSKSISVLNLRNTSAEKLDDINGFVIRQKGYDNTISAKFLCSNRDVESWTLAFNSRSSPISQQYASLPVLMEAEETHEN